MTTEMVHEPDHIKTYPRWKWLRKGRMPHIWCPGCGLGSATSYFIEAMEKLEVPKERIALVSGIGCTGRIAGYLNVDSFHTTHGRAIPFATGLQLTKPDMKVIVFSGDGDLFAIGGNHLIHAARRNMSITVLCVNNFNYGMTGGQLGPTTPMHAQSSTSPYGNYEQPFNLAFLADSCGAVYVARWTSYHVRQASKAIRTALDKRGFRFVEIMAPCPTLYSRRNRLGDGADRMRIAMATRTPRNLGLTLRYSMTTRGETRIPQTRCGRLRSGTSGGGVASMATSSWGPRGI